MKVIYIAGPYRAKTEWEVLENIRRAEALAIEVWRRGMVALCPHKNTAFLGGTCPDQTWLDGGLELLRRCDAVLFTHDFCKSDGAHKEFQEALRLGIPIYYYAGDIK